MFVSSTQAWPLRNSGFYHLLQEMSPPPYRKKVGLPPGATLLTPIVRSGSMGALAHFPVLGELPPCRDLRSDSLLFPVWPAL